MKWLSQKAQPVYRVEARRSFRVNERFPVTWRLQDREVSGTAKVRNISTTGMLLETSEDIPITKDSILAFNASQAAQNDFLPPLGRMIWSKQKGLGSARCLGIEFVDPAQEIIIRLRAKIEEKIAALQSAEALKAKVGTLLIVIMVALLAFFFIQQAIMQRNLERSNSLMLASAQGQANLFSGVLEQNRIQVGVINEINKELDTSKGLLAQAESMLSNLKAESSATINNLNTQISSMEGRNANLSKELAAAQARLRVYDGNPENFAEAKKAMALHRAKIRDIRMRIRELRNEAYLARVAAQKERDRIALENGNRGYIIKDSKFFMNPSQNPSARKIKINVSIVK